MARPTRVRVVERQEPFPSVIEFRTREPNQLVPVYDLLDDSAIVKSRVYDSRKHLLENLTSSWEILPASLLIERALVASRPSHELAGPPDVLPTF